MLIIILYLYTDRRIGQGCSGLHETDPR